VRNGCIHAFRGRQIRGESCAPRATLLFEGRFILIRHDHADAFLRQQVRDRFPDAMRPGGHEGQLAFDPIIHS
jgi:hypothetical protein